ncbi:MAG: S66 peptidase family protein [Flavobacterium sp.]
MDKKILFIIYIALFSCKSKEFSEKLKVNSTENIPQKITEQFQDKKSIFMKKPENLKKGDTLMILATARKHLSSLEPTINLLKNWGLEVKLGKTIGQEFHQLSGEDLWRATDFQEAINNPHIKAIWCVRGGYGTVKIIDKIDFSALIKTPKWIIGYSDVTVLHSHLHNLGLETLHATMPINLAKNSEAAKETLRKAIFGEQLSYHIPTDSLSINGKANGKIIGGNLSIIYSLMGSNSSMDTSGKILFLEDLDEYLYHVDRMMMNLKRSGYLKKLNGIIIGGMTGMKDNEIPWGKDAYQIILEHTKDLKIPVVFNFPAGHIADNRALIMGRNISLNVDKESTTLVFD